jgi:hypothetical protein
MGDKNQNENTASDSYRQTDNIDGGKAFVFDDVSKGYFNVVFDHDF